MRVKDIAARALREFEGMDYFPVDPAWRWRGAWSPPSRDRQSVVADIVGDQHPRADAGGRGLEIAGQPIGCTRWKPCRGTSELVFGGRDERDETYGGGRFLETGPVQADGTVEVDFNLAYNPPCVFARTRPARRPDREPVALRVEAGERLPKGGTLHP